MELISKQDAFFIIYIAIALFYSFVISWDIILYIKNRKLIKRHIKRVRRFIGFGAKLNEIRSGRPGDNGKRDDFRSPDVLNDILVKILASNSSETQVLAFFSSFNNAYPGFVQTINAIIHGLTPNEVRLCILIRLNISSKEIARLINITPESVNKARYRLRKKIGLTRQKDLYQFLLSI